MEAALAYVEYENVRKKERSVVGIHQLAMNQYYPKDVEISSFELDQEPPSLQIQSHMFVYMPEINGRHSASLVFLPSADEKIDRIESGFENGAYTRWKSGSDNAQNGQACFYCPAKFKGNKENSEEDFADTANEVTSSGVWNIHVYHSEGKLLKIRVKVIPSVSEADYQAMLKDLVRIQQELAMDAGGSVGFAAKWEHIYTDLAQQISDMKAVVKKIMLSPKTNLRQEYTLQSTRKIKKYTPRTIRDVYIKGRQTVNAISYSEDYDIYEHRAIKRYLLQIRRLCDQYSSLAEDEKNQNIRELERVFERHAENANKPEDIHDNLEFVEKLFNNPEKQIQSPYKEDVDVEFTVSNSCMDCFYEKYRFGLYPVLFKKGSSYIAEPICADLGKYGTYKFDFVGVDVRYIGANGVLFFYDCIQRIKEGNAKQIEIKGHCVDEPKKNNAKRYSTYEFVFSEIDSIVIDGIANRFADFDAACCTELRDTLKNDLLYNAWHNDRDCFEMEIKCKQNYYEELNRERRTKKQFERIKSDIDALMNNPLLRAVKPSDSIHITPVFQRDSRYRKAFEIMKRYRRQLKSIDLVDQSRYPVRKTCDIYEYWVFAKMLSIFCTEYSFAVRQFGQQKEDASLALIEDISSYIAQGNYNGTDVLLYHDGLKLSVEIKFNGLLKQKGKPDSAWRPDYQLIIKQGGQMLHFCMDAKYRDYRKQHEAWKHDLMDVAKGKYIDKAEGEIKGSYILHSDAECEPFYAGNRSLITRTIGEKLDKKYICGIGSIPLLPRSTEYFKTLLQMIFEYFVEGEIGYRKKCWMCGSDKIVVKYLQTKGGFLKYHMTCENPACRAFWVENHCSEDECGHKEFGKHLHNYLEEETPGKCWMVKCPICEYGGVPGRHLGNIEEWNNGDDTPSSEEYENMMPPTPEDKQKLMTIW